MSNLVKIKILGVKINNLTKKELNHTIIRHASSAYSRPLVIFKPYVEFLSMASRNEQIRKLLNKSDINVADSVALQWAASYLYGKPTIHAGLIHTYFSVFVRLQNKKWLTQVIPERMAGINQTIPLLRLANNKKLRIAVIGGPKDTNLTQESLKKRFPNIEVRVWSGYFGISEEKNILKAVSVYAPDILFCALGFPKQEKFIINNKNKLNAKVIIGEGGSFDYDQLGGKIKRAPNWMQNAGLEWLWRLALQPKRIKRQMAIPVFISMVRKQKLAQK